MKMTRENKRNVRKNKIEKKKMLVINKNEI